ncbi:hypothetical protein [Demequina mangrovi]|uniref:Uncharacterized protein n=1 Tax=Demequina mangrovi TaxID=1043493 RepID=A0A1H6TVP6_9MICO|nr:hypothetical protein [Demequina mangrovi]SEI82294.1 hypothetical protein SAMN05421637_0107 [Demequina mangrovi]
MAGPQGQTGARVSRDPREPMFGVCTLRVEVQPEHLLITITTSRSTDASAQRFFVSRPRSVASTREALELTEDFLQSFGLWEESMTQDRSRP